MKSIYQILLCLLAGTLAAGQGDYKKGVSYYQQKQYRKAIEEFQPIVAEQPEYEFGHRIIGFCRLQLGEYEEAIQALRESIRLEPDQFPAYRALALAYFNSARYREVMPTLDRAATLATAPRDRYEVARLRGTSAFNLAQYRLAVDSLEQAAAIQRGNADDTLQLGLAYFQLNEDDKAQQYLEQAVALEPGNEVAQRHLDQLQFRRATALIEAKQFERAGQLLIRFVESRPADGEGWFNLGLAYLFGDNLKAAEEAFRRTVRLIPSNSDAYDRLGFLYEKTNRFKEALTAYQKANALQASVDLEESIKRVEERISRAGS